MARFAVACVAIVIAGASGPLAQSQRDVRRVGLDERAMLETIVEDAVAGRNLGGHAWLKWLPHFFRGLDGKTYIPFTLRIDEAPGGFRNAAMYIRVAPRGDQGREGRRSQGIQNAVGIPNGELPVNSPERRQGVGAPTASDASLMLRSLTSKPTSPYPYDAAYGVAPRAEGAAGIIRRSLAVAPGEYDLYIALLEQGSRGAQRRWALLRQQLTVPNLSAAGLRLSSVVLADRIETLSAPLAGEEQALRPYALGTAEIISASDDLLTRDETLHLAFLIYDAAADEAGLPDVRVEYRLYHRDGLSERLLGSTPPQTLDPSTLPAGFNLRAGHQLASVQSLPLGSYAPGSYRIVIRVLDNRLRATAEQEIRFTIVS